MVRLSLRSYLSLAAVLAVAVGFYQQGIKNSVVFLEENLVELDPEQEAASTDGEGLYLSRCAACHGEEAEGNRSQMAGALASMPKWYLEEQLQKFRMGQRGAHPKDAHGQKMLAVAQGLGVAEQVKIIDYLVTVPPIAQESTLEGDVEWGKVLFNENCGMCHRYNGQGMSGFKSAPLNGQQDWYLLGQMEKFDQRVRGYHEDDASGHKMHLELDATPSREDRLALLAYISALSEMYPIEKGQER